MIIGKMICWFLCLQAVNTTSMWLLTNGTNSGVCKLVGDAIKMEKERRHVLASNYSRNIITTSKLEKLPKITAIGIVPISQLTYGDDFEVYTLEYTTTKIRD